MPLPPLETPRLLLRERAEGDVPAMMAMDADPSVMQFIGDGRMPDPAEQERKLRQRLREGYGEGLGCWCVFSRAVPDEMLGALFLVRTPEGTDIELAYRFRRAAWGQGYATEAGAAVLDYGFGVLKLPEIMAFTYPDNGASQRVLAKLGFAAAGRQLAYGNDMLLWRLRCADYPGSTSSKRSTR